MYLIHDETKGKTAEVDTLYVGCREIAEAGFDNVIARDHGRKTRLVAFYCKWENRVKPGFGATNYEREAITDYGF